MKTGILKGYLGYYAGFISRLMAMVIDTVIISFSYVAITWFISVTVTMLQVRKVLEFWIENIFGVVGIIDRFTSPSAIGTAALLYAVFYYVFFWSLTGQTPGKAVLGLRVVTTKGERISPLRAALRFCGYIVSAVPLFLGFIWILLDNRRQGWHDKIAGTYVAYTWAARSDEEFLADEIQQLHSYSSGESSPR